MGEEKRENPMSDYMDYLKKQTRNSNMTLWQVHQHIQCRLVAEYYGLSAEEIKKLDETLRNG